MQIPPMRPGPSRQPYYPPLHSIMHRPPQRFLMNVPPQPSIKKETALPDFTPFPSSQSTFATTASTSSSSFTQLYGNSNLPPATSTSAPLLPTINPSITDQTNLTQYEFGIESLPSLSSLPSLGIDGTSEVLQNSTLATTNHSTTLASNFPKLEEPYMGAESLVDIDTLMQTCSIEKTEPNNMNFVQMLEGTSNNLGSSFIPVSSDMFNSVSQQQPRPGDPRLFSPPPPQMSSPSVTPHHQTSIMSPHATVNSMSHHTRSHYPVGSKPAYSSSTAMSPQTIMNAMSPHSGVMSPTASGSVMSPPGHDHMPVQPVATPDPARMQFHQPSSMHMEMQHLPSDFNRHPQQNFNLMRNSNNNNRNNNLIPSTIEQGETTDSLEEILKNIT